MKIFKFGGASVKDAESVKNVASILSLYKKEQLIVVVSAMGKMTNALEKVVHAYYNQDPELKTYIDEIRNFHFKIVDDLGFPENHPLRHDLENCFVEIDWACEEPPSRGYGFSYDQIVSQGELMSTKIISAYLMNSDIANAWLDVRDVLQTDNTYREAKVNWELTEQLIKTRIPQLHASNNIIVTQGFIGGTSENFTTTLGREGSDYTAAIFSYCLDAKEMIVWKDVPGVLSADPRYSQDSVKLDQVSYHDAIELTYYGATVIHPKTIKPLENKHIPLRVCSFKSPKEKGTSVGNFQATKPLVPCFIYKPAQLLISISAKDFSFIAEASLHKIFGLFAELKIKINLMQNSAISFSVCVDNDPFKIPELLHELQKDFRVLYNEDLMLITVRHYYPSTIEQLIKGKKVLLEQRSRQTAQVVLKEIKS
ncbi:MAG: aspartate kinase [Bacteroidetes bacterium]|nr:aspartate kinase [Bacteroidota bacterium]MBK9541252.1 aspartate kinase [Bacteroidota bacterium]MBP6403416.1 aspartate kinase [Bacteroidia bacterium]MBP6648862.1 aspartate kinase [Bacteroidia bacterium]